MKRSAFFGLALLLLSSCGPQPLTVWKVSLFVGERPTTCYKDGIPPRDEHQTGVQMDMGTWEIYEGPEEKFFLSGVAVNSACNDLWGAQTLEGTFKDGVYTFEVVDTCVEKNRAAGPTETITESVQTTIKLTIDGDTFQGTWTEAETYGCEGSECDPDYAVDHPNCTVEHQLKGAKVEVENLHVL